MTATTQAQPAPALPSSPGLASRIWGFGSVFGKTVRDSRRAALAVGGILALILIGVSRAIAAEFDTPESRLEIRNLVDAVPPILQGLAGRPVNVETLGGYLSYKYGTFFPLIAALWSILALSGTLAAESRRGSMEFLAATSLTRRRIALEKLFGHIFVMVLAVFTVFVGVAIAGNAGGLPGDEISLASAAGYAIWLGLIGLVSGSVAFASAPFLGRGAAIGIAGAITFAGFILSGYQAAIPDLAPLANLTWWGWTTNHLPLAGVFDWASLVPLALLAVVLCAVGIESFARRDLGATSAIPTPRLPDAIVGLGGPFGRSMSENLPTSLSWALGIGLFGLALAASGRAFTEQLGSSPEFTRLLAQIFPNVDFATVGGFLQLLFVEFGLILAGLAAATLVGRLSSDETSGRLEFLLATPQSRVRWLALGGLGVFAGIAVITVVAVIGIAIGTASAGGEIATPVLGTLALGLYALAMGGIGIAIAGLFRASMAGGIVALLTIGTWFLDIVGPPLGLPAALHELALTGHFGQPMLGLWDPVGVLASLALAAGGLGLGAWGFARRDLRA